MLRAFNFICRTSI